MRSGRITQTAIAKAVGLEVSSVNKILNETKGPVFRKSTIEKVKRAAKRFGWQPKPKSGAAYIAILRDIKDVIQGQEEPTVKLRMIWFLIGKVTV